MSFRIYFPGNKKVYADFNGFTIETDQGVQSGGDGTAPEPYTLFLASLGTCAGIYVKGFCDSRGLSAEGIELEQSVIWDPINRKIGKIKIDIKVPSEFPSKYHEALIKVAEQCAVKKTIADPPNFEIDTVVYDKVIV